MMWTALGHADVWPARTRRERTGTRRVRGDCAVWGGMVAEVRLRGQRGFLPSSLSQGERQMIVYRPSTSPLRCYSAARAGEKGS